MYTLHFLTVTVYKTNNLLYNWMLQFGNKILTLLILFYALFFIIHYEFYFIIMFFLTRNYTSVKKLRKDWSTHIILHSNKCSIFKLSYLFHVLCATRRSLLSDNSFMIAEQWSLPCNLFKTLAPLKASSRSSISK